MQAHICIISPTLTAELVTYVEEECVIWQEKMFEAHDLEGAVLIFAATDSEKINESVEMATVPWQQLSRVDAQGQVDFITSTVIRRGDLLLAISTSGVSPSYTKKLKQELEEQFGNSYAQYIEFLKHCRQQILSHITDACAKRYALKKEIFERGIAGDIARCEAFLQSLLNNE